MLDDSDRRRRRRDRRCGGRERQRSDRARRRALRDPSPDERDESVTRATSRPRTDRRHPRRARRITEDRAAGVGAGPVGGAEPRARGLRRFSRGGSPAGARSAPDTRRADRAVRHPRDRTPRSAPYSGGNTQKVLLARALSRRPNRPRRAQPTRGLDVGACEYVHASCAGFATGGGGVLLVSEDTRRAAAPRRSHRGALLRARIGALPATEATPTGSGLMIRTGARVMRVGGAMRVSRVGAHRCAVAVASC